MSSEPEKSQRPDSGCTPLSIFYRRSLLMQGLGWMGGLGVLSSGLVGAKADPLPDVVVPTVEEAPPTVTTKAEPSASVAPKPSAPEASAISVPERSSQASVVRHNSNTKRRPRAEVVRKPSAPRINPQASIARKFSAPEREPELSVIHKPSAPEREPELSVIHKPSAPEREPETSVAPKPSLQNSASAPAVVDKPSTGTASTSPAVANKPVLTNDFIVSTLEEGPPSSVLPNQIASSPQVILDNNVYLDSKADSVGGSGSRENQEPIRRTKKPASVALSEGPTECKTVLKGPGLYRGVCGAVQLSQAPASTRRSVRVPNFSRVSMRQTRVAAVRPVNIGPIRVSASGFGARSRSYTTTPIAQNTTSPTSLASYNTTIPLFGLPNNSNTGFIFPLTIPAPITSVFGWRMHPILGYRRFHPGTDIGAPMGTPVLAAMAGQVQSADWMGGYGKAIVIQNSQTEQTLYGHLSEIFVQPGQIVEQGTVIGRVGSTGRSTGPHLHFEVRQLTNGDWVATDAGTQLQYGVAQLINALRTAQTTTQPGG
jgi:murein DD-endopeptidase MepM/ murein hydrolase activator NlpD